jgi:hypothetical protein
MYIYLIEGCCFSLIAVNIIKPSNSPIGPSAKHSIISPLIIKSFELGLISGDVFQNSLANLVPSIQTKF